MKNFSETSTPREESHQLQDQLFAPPPSSYASTTITNLFNPANRIVQLYQPNLVSKSRLACHDSDVDEVYDHVIMAVDKTHKVKFEIEPTTLILSARMVDETPYFSHRTQPSSVNNGLENTPLPYEIVVRPASDFRYETAITKLTHMDAVVSGDHVRFLVPGDNMDYDESQEIDELGMIDGQGKLLTVSGSLDLDNRLSVGCVGAIIIFIQQRRTLRQPQYNHEAKAAYRISRIETFTLKNLMLINNDTLSSLQIIQSEPHPDVANRGFNTSGSKESLSVYGLFQNLARTPQGKLKLRQMFLRPSVDLGTVASRHDFISLFLRPENYAICDDLSNHLCRVKNMKTTITSLRKGIERGSQSIGTIRSGVWAALLEFCYHCIDIGNLLMDVAASQYVEMVDLGSKILDKVHLQRIGKIIHDTVDLDGSLDQHRTVIKRGVSDDLDEAKDAYDGMEEVLAKIAAEITNEMPANFETRLNVVFLPQLGFHVTVPLNERTNEAIWRGDEHWDKRFKTEQYQYFKNNKMRAMDTHWGDLYATICDIEIEISHELAQNVLQNATWLAQASDFCGDLDSLLALTHGALQYKLTRPEMVEDNIINIKGGRHILQEMTVASYVPNDAAIVGGDEGNGTQGPSMILLTGPNYSGKSVYKKQVALIVYMAQIGSFVPADSAILGITDQILTRINTAETVSKSQSAFVIDLQQIAWALKRCTNRSLVVIDEFGNGTDSCDGAGLATGVLKYLLDLGSESPKVLASTHFHEIFEQEDFENHSRLQLAHMEVRVDTSGPTKSQQETRVTYLYSLRNGRSTLSFGNQCAAMNGIPKDIVKRATTLADLMIQGVDLVAICASLAQAELEDLEQAEAICRTFLGKDILNKSPNLNKMLEDVRKETGQAIAPLS